jgi:hypothetical protein
MDNESGQALEIAKEAVKEVAKDAYVDIGRPIAKPTGQLAGLVPRAIKAALAPVEKWVLQREYNVAETQKLLEIKLQNITPAFITPPEPHIAVPALQYISYCMDNEELRDMYANLLANSMNSVVKNGVHPGFVEIIKQLSPDEAKFLKYMKDHKSIPTIGLHYEHEYYKKGFVEIIKEFTNVPALAGCENQYSGEQYIDNLVRLGLVVRDTTNSFTDKTRYEPLKNDPEFAKYNDVEIAKQHGFDKCKIVEHIVRLTVFGEKFCSICLSTAHIVDGDMQLL